MFEVEDLVRFEAGLDPSVTDRATLIVDDAEKDSAPEDACDARLASGAPRRQEWPAFSRVSDDLLDDEDDPMPVGSAVEVGVGGDGHEVSGDGRMEPLLGSMIVAFAAKVAARNEFVPLRGFAGAARTIAVPIDVLAVAARAQVGTRGTRSNVALIDERSPDSRAGSAATALGRAFDPVEGAFAARCASLEAEAASRVAGVRSCALRSRALTQFEVASTTRVARREALNAAHTP
ncbi:MAG TPA: hypothetical protein VFF73_03475 [Planctomycetota bacterium]|nr:hypothetical protein [Planctomycetota bacterium]